MITAGQLHAFRQAVKAQRSGNINAFGYWLFATYVAFGAGGDCFGGRTAIWRAVHRWATEGKA